MAMLKDYDSTIHNTLARMEAILKEEVHVEVVNSAMAEEVDTDLVNELFDASDEGRVRWWVMPLS